MAPDSAAIQPRERHDYAKVMSDVVKPGGRILLDVVHMEKPSQRSGPPYRCQTPRIITLVTNQLNSN